MKSYVMFVMITKKPQTMFKNIKRKDTEIMKKHYICNITNTNL